MKISDKTNLTGTQRRKLSLGLLLLLISGGIVAGTVIVCSADSLDAVSKSVLTQNLLKTSEVKTIIQIYINAFLPLAAALTIQYICGFSALGQPLTIAGIIYRGVSTGVSASVFYLMLGIKGFLAILIMLFPFAAVSSVILILGARESIKFSNMFMNFALNKNVEEDKRSGIKLYTVKFIVLIALSLLAAAADSIITYFFTGILLNP